MLRCVHRDQKDSTWTAVKMRPDKIGEGNTYGGEGGDLLDPLLVVRDFVTGCALLPEPEHPTAGSSDRGCTRRGREVRTYVFLNGWTGAPPTAPPSACPSPAVVGFSSTPTEVEKCFEDAIRNRGRPGDGLERASAGVTGVVGVEEFVVPVVALGKREAEWFEK